MVKCFDVQKYYSSKALVWYAPQYCCNAVLTLESLSDSSDGTYCKFVIVEIGPRRLKCHVNIIMSFVFKCVLKWKNLLSLHNTV